MKFNEDTGKKIIKKNNLSANTLKVWRHRGEIPDIYFEEGERVSLVGKVLDREIERARDKYGKEIERLLETRKFKPGMNDAYYNKCLISLCRECETYKKTGKLS